MSVDTTGIGMALGKVPSGLAVATAAHGGARTAFLASWFQQLSFEPPLVGVCIKAGRPIVPLVEGSGHFALNLVGEGDSTLLKRYGRGFEPGVDPWAEAPDALRESDPAPVLRDAYAYLVLRLVRVLEPGGDHLVYVGEVVDGAVLRPEGKPAVHLRKSGFGY